MPAASKRSNAKVKKFDRLHDFGLRGVAWEFLRRDPIYWRRYHWVFKTKNEELKLREEDVALEYGLKKLKDPKEWYFQGEAPQFASLRMVRFDYNKAKKTWAQKRRVHLAEGQVGVTFDLRSDVSMQLKLAERQLRAQQARWVKDRDITDDVRQRLPRMTASTIPHYVNLVRALDLHQKDKPAAYIGRKVLGESTAEKEKEGGRQLVDLAKAMYGGQYRLLILGAMLEYDVPSARRTGGKAPGKLTTK
jgi:hypothetical protein